MAAAKAVSSSFESIGKSLKQIGGNIKTAASTKPGKTLATGAAVGGAVALTGAGAGIGLTAAGKGAKAATNAVTDSNPFNGIIKLFKSDATDEEARAGGSIIGIAVIAGLILLAVFVIIPQFNKSRKGGK